jgi:hypothetical protein
LDGDEADESLLGLGLVVLMWMKQANVLVGTALQLLYVGSDTGSNYLSCVVHSMEDSDIIVHKGQGCSADRGQGCSADPVVLRSFALVVVARGPITCPF